MNFVGDIFVRISIFKISWHFASLVAALPGVQLIAFSLTAPIWITRNRPAIILKWNRKWREEEVGLLWNFPEDVKVYPIKRGTSRAPLWILVRWGSTWETSLLPVTNGRWMMEDGKLIFTGAALTMSTTQSTTPTPATATPIWLVTAHTHQHHVQQII